MYVSDQLMQFETLLRGPESGNRRSGRLLDDSGNAQVSAKTVWNVNDEMWWLQLKIWTAAVDGDLASRGETWQQLLINGITLGVDCHTQGAGEDESWKRAQKAMVERGLWLP